MEVALLTRFFDSKILFSLSFEHYERHLKHELLMCHKHIGFTMSELMKMSVHDRRSYIQIHNHMVKEENQRRQGLKSASRR